MADNETFADIIAEMRALSNPISDGIIAINGRSIADRLEAAWKREKAAIEADALAAGGLVEASRTTAKNSSAVGNAAAKQEAVTASHGLGYAAKLREALKLCVDEMCDRCRELAAARGNPLPCLSGCEPVRKAKFALVKPLRNCDRFDSFPQAYDEWYKTEVLPRVNGVVGGVESPFEEWLFLPATEQKGENNANK